MALEGALHDPGSVLTIPPTVVDQDRCESDDLEMRRRSTAVSVVTAALIVLAVVVCAIYFQ